MRPLHLLLAVLVLVPVIRETSRASDETWPQFRGPTGRGHTDAPVPTSWQPGSVAWSVDLPAAGQSSPTVWGDRIYLTGASDEGAKRHVFCLSRDEGTLLWSREIPCANPEETHKMNTRATPTVATDGTHVVAFFGPGGLHCFNTEGETMWSLDLGDFPGGWGIAASPVIYGDVVIQNCDATGPSRLVAVELATGEIRWETQREDKPRGGWSTPILIEHGGKRELVLNGEFGVRGYDPESGRELWFCEGFNGRGAPVPEFADGRLYVVNGKPGDVYCVEPGGKGNVTATHRLWHAPRKGGRDLPSPAVVGDYLFVTSMSGIASCYDVESGEVLWTERLGEALEIAAGPLVANGLIYVTNVFGGETIVIRPGPELEIVAVNELGADSEEEFRATITPVGQRLYLRSHSRLYCVE